MTRRWCEIDSGSLFFCFPTFIVTDVTATHLAMKGFSLVEHNDRSSSTCNTLLSSFNEAKGPGNFVTSSYRDTLWQLSFALIMTCR